jgi:hypothetical protein
LHPQPYETDAGELDGITEEVNADKVQNGDWKD